MHKEIKTDRLLISLITKDDVQAVFHTLNHEKTANAISFLSWPMTIDQAETWCETSINGYKQKTDYMYLARKGGQPIGGIGLHPSQDTPHWAETGYWVDEKHQGKGYASEMLRGIIRLAFEDMDITQIYATTAIDNDPSANLLKKAGFIADGKKDVKLPDGSIRPSNKYTLTKR